MKKNELKLTIFGRIAKIFVMNEKLTLLLILFLFSWGIFSFILTPKQYNPDIVAPAFQVITEFPGATEKEVYELISKPMENVVMDIDGVDKVVSESRDGGVSILIVNFFVGEDIDSSKIKLQQKFNSNINLMPPGALTPFIKTIDPDNVPILVLGIKSSFFNQIELRKFAFYLRDKLKVIPNISNIEIKGGQKRQLSILIDPQKLNAYKISVLELEQLIKSHNIRVYNNEFESSDQQIYVEVDGVISNKESLEKLIVLSDKDKVIYLKDIANIEDRAEEISNFTSFQVKGSDIEDVVYLSIAKKKGSNIIKVSNDLLNFINNDNNIIPNHISISILRNEGETASNEINGLIINLFQAILIVGFVLLIFLSSRPAFIVAIVIPLTLAVVFGSGFLVGQTINRITLFALILSLGLLVDSATVVVENILRHLKENEKVDDRQVVIKAVDEVGMGLFMSTVTTVFAFIPMAFISGMMGPYMAPIPFFVPAALIASLFIALSINPWLSYKLLGNKKLKEKKESYIYLEKIKVISKSIQSSLMKKYRNILYVLLNNHKIRKFTLILVLFSFVFVMILPVFQVVKFRMLPKADRNQFYLYIDLPENTLLHETRSITNNISTFLSNQTYITNVQSFVGMPPVIDFNGLFKGAEGRSEEYQSTLKINLINHNERSITSEDIVLNIRHALQKFLKNNPDIKFKLIEDPPGPPVQSTMLAKIQGENFSVLNDIAKDTERIFKNIEGVVDIDTTVKFPGKQIIFNIDKEKASRSLVRTDAIVSTLKTYFDGSKIGLFHNGDFLESEFIFLQLEKSFRSEQSDFNHIYIKNTQGDLVPLSAVIQQLEVESSDILRRDDRLNTVYVYSEMGNRSVTYATIDAFKLLLNYKLPSGKGKISHLSLFGITYYDEVSGESYRVQWGGEWKLTLEVFRDLGLAMMVAIFLIYFVLVAQFKSFKTPLIIMGSIPLSMIGVMPGFAILGQTIGLYFNATSMIGVIALAGIVVNNAIILLEYLNSLRKEGYTIENALIASCVTRLRPILLTTATTILGSLTIIGDPVWAGLAWSIIFGLSISSALTLIIFPVLYYVFEGKNWNNEIG